MNEHNKKMSIDASNINEHSKISADMSTNVTLKEGIKMNEHNKKEQASPEQEMLAQIALRLIASMSDLSLDQEEVALKTALSLIGR